MKFYEDLLDAGTGNNLMTFIKSAISDYKSSTQYTEAVTAYEYFRKRNVTISEYRKLLYTMTGEAVPDNYSADYKFCNAFFPIFVKQENSYLLGDGITFNNSATKDKLGGDEFDSNMYTAGEYALWGGVSFVFLNLDHIEIFKATEFVPLIGEEDGAMHAGIRWWQVASNKPLRATLYEEDGYTDFIWRLNDKGQTDKMGAILHPKRPYVQIIGTSAADGDAILDGKNYPGFPIVPLWANKEHQSELTGLREKIDGYDLIQSGLCNTIDDASLIYWTIQNAGGMDDVDLAQFLERMRTVKAAIVDDEGARAEAHTLDVPYQATETVLASLRDSLYRDAMALDTDKLSAGNVTATAINSAYENLELKCDGYEYCVSECVKALLELIGIDDAPTYHRRKNTNQPEVTNMVLAAGQYLDDETILKHLPFLNIDEIKDILKRKDKEEADRYAELKASIEDEPEDTADGGEDATEGPSQGEK
jgi:hypothetical protein